MSPISDTHHMFNVLLSQRKKGHMLMVWTLIYHTFLSTSLIFPLLGVSSFTLVAINFILILLTLVLYNRKINSWAIILVSLIIVFTFVKVIVFGDIRFFKINLFLITTVLLVSLSEFAEVKHFVDISSKIMLVVLIGSAVGLFLNQFGVSPVFSFVADNGRLQSLYYTSFGHQDGSVLRASGIYDEPGTLAFMLGGLLVLRHILSFDQKRTLLLLALGFVTFSLALFVFSLFFISAIDFKKGQRIKVVLLLISIALFVFISGFDELLETTLFSRISFDKDSEYILGGGRETLFTTAYENLLSHEGSILWGVHPYCTINPTECLNSGYMGENPLAPVAYHGIFIAWPYYVYILLTLAISLKSRRNLIFLAMMSLFLQRPYLLNYGVSLLGILPVYLYYSYYRKSKHVRA